MASSNIYWVKEERGLFRKPEWSVTLNTLKFSLHKERDEAVQVAVTEAERTSILGRSTEVWVDEGHGFLLYKAFKASKPEVPDEDEDGGGDDGDDNSMI